MESKNIDTRKTEKDLLIIEEEIDKIYDLEINFIGWVVRYDEIKLKISEKEKLNDDEMKLLIKLKKMFNEKNYEKIIRYLGEKIEIDDKRIDIYQLNDDICKINIAEIDFRNELIRNDSSDLLKRANNCLNKLYKLYKKYSSKANTPDWKIEEIIEYTGKYMKILESNMSNNEMSWIINKYKEISKKLYKLLNNKTEHKNKKRVYNLFREFIN